MFKLECGAITATVQKADPTPGETFSKGWVADVAFMGVQAQEFALDADTAKQLAIDVARGLCEKNKVDIPTCLDDPAWASS